MTSQTVSCYRSGWRQQPLRGSETIHTSSIWEGAPLAARIMVSLRTGATLGRGALISPAYEIKKSERISPVKKHIPPLTTSSGYTIVPDIEVLLYGRG
jgi:hypothetical protein